MTTQTAWPYDARRDDPLTEMRIPVVSTIFPQWSYLVALCINEDPDTPLWHGVRPTDHEATMVRALIDYERSRYNPGWVTRHLDARPFDIDGSFNGLTLVKRGDDDWAYRRSTWERGPYLVPFTLEGHPEAEKPVDLAGLCDRIHRIGDELYHDWVAWKDAHPEVYQAGACGDLACRAFEWHVGDYPGIAGAVLVCSAHGQPAPGWAYTQEPT